MDVTAAIAARRAYRSLLPVEITADLVLDLARHAQLAPSCSNNQPWRFVFVFSREAIAGLHPALNTPTNDWARAASLIVVAFSRKEDDCIIREREYHLLDTGMAAAFLILRATEIGLVAHPIAGFSPKKTRESLGIPDEFQILTLICCGRKADAPSPVLSPKQLREETERPERLALDKFVFFDRFGGSWPGSGAR